MASPKNPQESEKPDTSDAIEDAVEVEQEAPESTPDEPDATVEPDKTADDVEDSADDVIDAEIVDPVDPIPAETPTPPAVEKVVVKRGGVVAPLIGGALCVALGYAGAQFLKPSGWPFPGANTAELETRLAGLEAEVDTVKSATADLTANVSEQTQALSTTLDTRIGEVTTALSEIDVTEQIAPLSEQLTNLERRLTGVEARPVEDAIVSPEATAAYERQLSEMQALLDSEIKRLEQAKESAENEVRAANQATAVTTLLAAIDTGAPFAAPLAESGLSATDEMMAAAKTGVPTASELQDSFPDAARAALRATAREAQDAGEQGWFQTVLRTQVGLRSTTPKEGDDPDAILSRAQAAVREERFNDALAEIAALPEVGQEAMSDWTSRAKSRADVLAGIDTLLEQ
ncbi:hypothetical protein [Celeribacter arenosi]|uniref:Mitochondrial inner membrane protein n=1 Tax=Celeribacter arenosi TaxID=792649 RepID=A0ABP7JZ42_9RHOB